MLAKTCADQAVPFFSPNVRLVPQSLVCFPIIAEAFGHSYPHSYQQLLENKS
jgi:hypothetical protein